MKISVSVALNTKGPSAKVKEKMKVARAALKHLAKVGMGSGVINAAAMDKIIASLNALKGYDKLPVIGPQVEVGEHFRDVLKRDMKLTRAFGFFELPKRMTYGNCEKKKDRQAKSTNPPKSSEIRDHQRRASELGGHRCNRK